MIAVHKRPERISPDRQAGHPVEFPLGREMLDDSQQRHRKAKHNQEPRQEGKVRPLPKRLRRQKKQNDVRRQPQHFHPRQKRIGRAAQKKLQEPYRQERQQRPIERVPLDRRRPVPRDRIAHTSSSTAALISTTAADHASTAPNASTLKAITRQIPPRTKLIARNSSKHLMASRGSTLRQA